MTRCRVPGCGAEVHESTKRKLRVCVAHRRVLVLRMPGYLGRFCQQCSRVHELGRFDGDRRGCRARLRSRTVRCETPQSPTASPPSPRRYWFFPDQTRLRRTSFPWIPRMCPPLIVRSSFYAVYVFARS